jgi:hypothetical protein
VRVGAADQAELVGVDTEFLFKLESHLQNSPSGRILWPFDGRGGTKGPFAAVEYGCQAIPERAESE